MRGGSSAPAVEGSSQQGGNSAKSSAAVAATAAPQPQAGEEQLQQQEQQEQPPADTEAAAEEPPAAPVVPLPPAVARARAQALFDEMRASEGRLALSEMCYTAMARLAASEGDADGAFALAQASTGVLGVGSDSGFASG
jgi:hypothetical protein